MTGLRRDVVYDCEALASESTMSYRFKSGYDRVEYVLRLEQEVERLSYLVEDENGERVSWELRELDAEVERLRAVLVAKDAEVVRAKSGAIADELRVENVRLRSELVAARRETGLERRTNDDLRRQVATLMAAGGGRRRLAVASAAVEREVLGDRGRWAGLELA